ncbi:MAG: hypothetical protein ABIG43_02270 [Chloroflexota bacterium]
MSDKKKTHKEKITSDKPKTPEIKIFSIPNKESNNKHEITDDSISITKNRKNNNSKK